ncbi:MAG TPA: hypothetical protein VK158_05500 [Acidobacteriota bacterium]|nr:hypothetical protein [Acidobacteriota bacterium]
MKRIQKRGQADSQFHWLFVLLAGGFILFLFFMLATAGIRGFILKQTAETLKSIESTIGVVRSQGNIDAWIDASDAVSLAVSCDILRTGSGFTDVSSLLSVQGKETNKPIRDVPLFSEKIISGEHYAVKSIPSYYPFRADTALYMSSFSTLYVIVGADAATGKKIIDLLPKNASSVQVGSIPELTNKGFDMYVFIGVNQGQQLSSQVPSFAKKYRYVDIQPGADGLITSGDFVFYSLTKISGTTYELLSDPDNDGVDDISSYRGEAEFAGGLVSPYDIYTCTKFKMYRRVRATAGIMAIEADVLKNSYPTTLANSGQCIGVYGLLSDKLLQLHAGPAVATDEPDVAVVNEVDRLNGQLELSSCQVLY